MTDRSIFSSKFPKQYDSLFDYSRVLLRVVNMKLFFFWFALLQNNFMFTNLTKGVNQHCSALEILKKILICLVIHLAVKSVKTICQNNSAKKIKVCWLLKFCFRMNLIPYLCRYDNVYFCSRSFYISTIA